MKKYKLIGLFLFLSSTLWAQDPASWRYSAIKVANNTYEIHISATIDDGWHLYSQTQPKDAIAIPTSIKFNKNPILSITSKTKELGKLEKHTDPSLGIEQWQYSNKVDFVQTVKLKVNVKTNISGSIEFQTCTDEMCLPPTTINFSIPL